LALVAIGAIAIGSYAIAPAIGGPSKLTTKRAKTLFYTKTLSNQRYYSKAAADARYLPKQSGETHVTLDPWDWDETGSGASRSTPAPPAGGFIAFNENDDDNDFNLHDGSVLSQVVSKGLRLQAIEICYELDSGATVDRLQVWRAGPNNGDPVPTQNLFIDDQTDRTTGECHRFNGAATPVGGGAILDLRLTVDFPAPGEIRIGRTTAIFVP
jgi:hypothetical protein